MHDKTKPMVKRTFELDPESTVPRVPHKRWRPRFILVYLSFLLLGAVALLMIAEVVIRLAVPDRYWRYYVAQDNWLPDPVLGWRNKPNLNFARFDSEMIVIRTNDDGLQIAQSLPARSGSVLRVMLIGDSTVFGGSVVEDARLHHQLARNFAARGIRAEVLNAGVEGYSTDQCLLALESLVPRYRPQLVIHMVCANDFYGNDNMVNYGLPKPRFVEKEAGHFDFILPNMKNSLLAEDAKPWSLRSAVQKFAVYRMLRPAVNRIRAMSYWRSERRLAQSDDMSPTPKMLDEANWALFRELLSRMRAVCSANGAALVLTQHPSIGEIENNTQTKAPLEIGLTDAARACGVSFCPTIEALRQARSRGPFYLLPRDAHCNGAGYKQIAACLDDLLRANHTPAHSNSQHLNGNE